MPSYIVDADRSTVLVAARSTVGPIVFEGRDLRGRIDLTLDDQSPREEPTPRAELTIDLRKLRSGNELYDAELRRRIDVRRFPECHLVLDAVTDLGDDRFTVSGDVTVQDTTRQLTGTVEVGVPSPDRLTVVGEKSIDIRDFKITTPQLLMMRIYPEVRVQLFLDVKAESDEETP